MGNPYLEYKKLTGHDPREIQPIPESRVVSGWLKQLRLEAAGKALKPLDRINALRAPATIVSAVVGETYCECDNPSETVIEARMGDNTIHVQTVDTKSVRGQLGELVLDFARTLPKEFWLPEDIFRQEHRRY
jgi:hypothetical protein